MPNGDRYHDCPNLIQMAQDAVRQIKEANETIRVLEDNVRSLKSDNAALRRVIELLKEKPPKEGKG